LWPQRLGADRAAGGQAKPEAADQQNGWPGAGRAPVGNGGAESVEEGLTGEAAARVVPRAARTRPTTGAARLWGNRKVLVGLAVIAVLTLAAILEPWLVRFWVGNHSPTAIGDFPLFAPPSAAHPLGTDRFGQDTLALVLVALRNSLGVGALAGLFGTVIGVVVGFVAGFEGRWIDHVLRTVTDAWLVIPTFPILATLAAFVRVVTLTELALILAVFSWPFAARSIRAQVLTLRQRPYVELARLSGEGNLQIIFTEILPNMLPYLGVGFAGSVVGAIGALVGLAIIGVGAANAISLGTLISDGIGWGVMSLGLPEILIVPALILMALFIALNLVNFGLEEVYNPRLQGAGIER
jgi:peptide/nickel transport system permease protein